MFVSRNACRIVVDLDLEINPPIYKSTVLQKKLHKFSYPLRLSFIETIETLQDFPSRDADVAQQIASSIKPLVNGSEHVSETQVGSPRRKGSSLLDPSHLSPSAKRVEVQDSTFGQPFLQFSSNKESIELS